MQDPKSRFSDRAADYARARPDYPREVLELLKRETGLGMDASVADIGAGTGISTRMLLETGCRVFAIEPNAAMRATAEAMLGENERFVSLSGSAEATGLPPASMTHVVAAQAWHWFDKDAARVEFQRILQPDGWVVLLWNFRLTDGTPFLREYEQLLCEHGVDYGKVRDIWPAPEEVRPFFSGDMHAATFQNTQALDLDGLRARAASSSYVPAAGHPKHLGFFTRLQEIFDKHAVCGVVPILYETKVYWGNS